MTRQSLQVALCPRAINSFGVLAWSIRSEQIPKAAQSQLGITESLVGPR